MCPYNPAKSDLHNMLKTYSRKKRKGMGRYWLYMVILTLVSMHGCVDAHLNSKKLCSQCSRCETSKCPPSESYPHMTAFDNTLIAGALQSDYVQLGDRGVYSVPNIVGGETTEEFNSYFGWKSSSGAASGYHRFSNYMDKCSGESYLAVDEHGKVGLKSLSSLHDLAAADWKSINPPAKLNHKEFRFWVSRSTGKCLTVFFAKTFKRTVGVADCKFDGSNNAQLFAFRFHYHNSFCCCGVHNE